MAFSACASVSFQRDTETSGTFRSSGLAMTIFSIDMPKAALDIARENASDANLGNMVVETVMVTPYLGPLDWIQDLMASWFDIKVRGRLSPEDSDDKEICIWVGRCSGDHRGFLAKQIRSTGR